MINVLEKGRWVRKETCPDTGKVCHDSRADCQEQVNFYTNGNVRRRNGQGKTRKAANAYRCEFCNRWHVGILGRRS